MGYHARLEKDSIIETRDSRYKAGMRWRELEEAGVEHTMSTIGRTIF
jgi:hypothetical protein